MAIWMVGIDYNKAGIDVRSLFSFTKKQTAAAYASLHSLKALSGCVILSTCNRTEWWLSVEEEAAFSPADVLCDTLHLSRSEYEPYFIERRDREAVHHLFRLAAGLESQIMGEDQIITQVGDAITRARECYAADHTLEVLFRMAVTAGKKVKTQTDLSTADSSVIHTALRVLEANGFSAAGKKCLVIGNGMMGRLSALTLTERGADVTVTVRQYTSGVVDIPRGCKRINYDERYRLLPECELVVSATSSPNCTLRCRELEALHVGHPVCLVDLAVPRDIEPEAGNLPGFTLYDVDSFHLDRSEKLQDNVDKAEAILAEQEKDFYVWFEGRDLVPRIRSLKESAGRDVDARLTPALRAVPLSGADKQALEQEVAAATERMMNRLLFGMRERMSTAAFSQCVEAMEFVFDKEA